MKRFMVTLNVVSSCLRLIDLTTILAKDSSPGARDKDDPIKVAKVSRSVWKLASPLPEQQPLEDHIRWIFSVLPPTDLMRRLDGASRSANRDLGIELVISVGVLFDTATCSIQLSSKLFALFAGSGIGLEITCYPCLGGEGKETTARK
jgi:hypothetical protein